MSSLVESLYHQLAYFNASNDIEISEIVIVELYLQELTRLDDPELFFKDANSTKDETMMTLVKFEDKVINDARLLTNFKTLVAVFRDLSESQVQKRVENIKISLMARYKKHKVQVFKDN